jgi:hypothetical protein
VCLAADTPAQGKSKRKRENKDEVSDGQKIGKKMKEDGEEGEERRKRRSSDLSARSAWSESRGSILKKRNK